LEAKDLSKAINRELQRYAKVEKKILNNAVKKVTKEAVNELKATSPKDTGDYGSSWKGTTEKKVNGDSSVIYASKGEYRLTHLLEKGHAKRGGGRVAAIPHIKKVEKKSIRAIEEEVMKG
jgi:mRNA-degrading endonuclease YafQ of YafQ-DinJ toxin-antitoxin module